MHISSSLLISLTFAILKVKHLRRGLTFLYADHISIRAFHGTHFLLLLFILLCPIVSVIMIATKSYKYLSTVQSLLNQCI